MPIRLNHNTHLRINGLDITSRCTRYGFEEVPRKVYGGNGFISITGVETVDLLRQCLDLNIVLLPNTADDINDILLACKEQYITVEYFSRYENKIRTSVYIPEAGTIKPALLDASKDIVEPVAIVLRER